MKWVNKCVSLGYCCKSRLVPKPRRWKALIKRRPRDGASWISRWAGSCPDSTLGREWHLRGLLHWEIEAQHKNTSESGQLLFSVLSSCRWYSDWCVFTRNRGKRGIIWITIPEDLKESHSYMLNKWLRLKSKAWSKLKIILFRTGESLRWFTNSRDDYVYKFVS